MSWLMDWLFGKSEKQLLKMKDSREIKIKKLKEEIDAINAELTKKD